MGNEIPLQLAQFLRSFLLGSTLALFYDISRSLRILGGRLWELLLDILLSLCAAASLFFFIMAEEGELRLFILFGTLGGAVLFFSILSDVFRPIWTFWMELFLFPLHIGHIFMKKLSLFFKKVFSFFRKGFTIMGTPNGEEQAHGTQSVKTENAPEQ